MENNIGNDSVRQEVSQSSTERVNTIQIERRFELEKDIMTAITSGNRLKMQELLEIRRQICPDNQCCENRAASDVLRGCKNNLVSFNTVCRIAARQGGLQPLYLYNIYNKYALIIEKATSVQYLNEDLYAQMSLEYIDSVMAFSVSSYSPVIQKIVTYLTCHLDEDVTVVDLSKIHRMHVSHISRKFKQETGMSIPEYVNQQRIGLGKLYFETGNCSITEVSGMLGYHDSNYFGKIFKKVTGDTPSQYLRKINSRQDVR